MSNYETNIETGSYKGRLGVFIKAHSSRLIAVLYLACIVAAETVTWFVHPIGGIVAYLAILISLIIHSALTGEQPAHKLLLALTLGPLIRILSLAMPIFQLSQVYGYLVIAIPLFLAVAVVMRNLGYKAHEVGLGLNIRMVPVQLLVAATGV